MPVIVKGLVVMFEGLVVMFEIGEGGNTILFEWLVVFFVAESASDI